MAGHSKFKNIMHRKGAQDKKRSAAFSKLSREITVAAKSGMPDPDMNPRLRLAVNNARAAVDAQGQHPARDRQGEHGRRRRLRGDPLRRLWPGRRGADRRGADRQPQPHRHQRAHRVLQERRQPGRDRRGQPRLRADGHDRVPGQRGRRGQGHGSRDRGGRRRRRERRGRPHDLDRHGRHARGREGARGEPRRGRERQAGVEAEPHGRCRRGRRARPCSS